MILQKAITHAGSHSICRWVPYHLFVKMSTQLMKKEPKYHFFHLYFTCIASNLAKKGAN